MQKRSHLPDSLIGQILPFDWDVKKVWGLAADIELVSRLQLDYLLDLPFWTSVPGKGMLFDISPMRVIRNPQVSPHQYQRIENADISHPLDFLICDGHPWILDGIHRLARHYIMKSDVVQIRFHSSEVIPYIKVSQ